MLNVPSEENQENETLNVSIIVKWAISITINRELFELGIIINPGI